jgi:hypothetical protein
LLLAAPASTAVIALDDSPAAAAAVAAMTEAPFSTEETRASQAELKTVLTGSPTPAEADEDALRRMLLDARQYEAHFETAEANALRRQVLRAFENAIRPSRALRLLAAEASLEIAAGLLVDGDRSGATRAAREALRRFPLSVDTTYRAPATVDFLAAQQRAVAAGSRVQVTIRSDRAGTVFADGMLLGETDGVLVTSLLPGRYRLWLEWPGGESLPHVVDVQVAPPQVRIETALDKRLRLEPVVGLQCDGDCTRLMAALGRRLSVSEVKGVCSLDTSATRGSGAAFRLIEVDTETGEARESLVAADGSPFAADSAPLLRRPRFQPLYLVPFGGGQLAQDRPITAAAYAAAGTGLLAWYLVSWRRHADAVSANNADRAKSLRQQRDLAGVLFVSSLAATVAESLIVGWLTGEREQVQ